MNLDILYEDGDVIVCYKPSGIPTQTRQLGQQDMETLLKRYRAAKKEPAFIGVIHRLDQPVEGVMVFAKTKEATASLSKQVRERTIGKHYFAYCEGTDAGKNLPMQGSLTDYIVFDKKSNLSRIVPEESAKEPDAKKAVLDYKRTQKDGASLFDVTLHTGRHHQIRLQLSNAGWPIAGDLKYNPSAKRGAGLGLCSYKVEFAHPRTGEEMTFEIEPRNPLFANF